MRRLGLSACFVLALATAVSAQVGTETLAWAPEHRALADALGTAAVIGQGVAAAITSVKAWHDGDHKPAFKNGCSIATAMIAASTLKAIVHEERPNGVDNHSFPSGHSAAAASLSGWNFTFGISVASFTGLTRVNANWHHLWKDVVPGEAIGALAQVGCSAIFR